MFLKHTKVVTAKEAYDLVTMAGEAFGSVMKFADSIDFGRSQVYRWKNKESQMSKETYDRLTKVVAQKLKANKKGKK